MKIKKIIKPKMDELVSNNKKRGFTLIELIVVMAILGILATILIPNILGYTNKARKSQYQSSAKVILNAVEAYNADASTPISLTDSTEKVSDAVTALNADGENVIDSSKIPQQLRDVTMDKLENVADGEFTVGAGNSIVITAASTGDTGA